MEIHHEELSDVLRYIHNKKFISLEDKRKEFEIILQRIKKFKSIDKDTKILEIGTGTGWFPILCKKEGITCRGIEISPQLVEYAKQFGGENGIEPDISLGNIEDTHIGTSQYDVILALAVFEHVEHYEAGLKKIFNALKPGGVLYFTSTNKFSIRQTEYNFPFYSWLSDSLRYSLRKHFQNKDIMKLGIDFHQFSPFKLSRYFKQLGFSYVYDWTELLDPEGFVNPKASKKMIIKMLKRVKVLRIPALLFSKLTFFICVK